MAARAAQVDVQRKIGAEVGRIIQSLDNAAEAARSREAALRESFMQMQGKVADEGRSAVRLTELQSEADAARSLYISVLDRLRQTANEADMQEPDAVLISAAVPAIAPALPTRKQLALLVTLSAPVLALLIALLRDRMRAGLRSAEALEELTGLPCLAFAPSRRGRRGRRAFAAAVAGLPTMLGPVRPRVLLLTSSVPGEGTSVLAEALARSIAETGDQVLLVVCGPGLAAPILPQANLEVISAMPPALPQATRLNYDLIILDTPAVLASSKTLPLVGVAEATLLVVRYGHTPAPVVMRAARLLRRHRARLAGTVVTRVEPRELSAADGTALYLQRRTRAAIGRAALRAR
jgi:Mrp family chromosome partitioning ATPase